MTNFDAAANAANFAKALGNGKTALRHMSEAFVNVAAQNASGLGDATQLARLIDRATVKGDDAAARAVAFFVGKVWDGAKLVRAKGQPCSIKLKGSTFKPEALAIIEKAVLDELSIRSTTLKGLFEPKVPKAEKEEKSEAETAPRDSAPSGATATPEAPVTTPLSELDAPAVPAAAMTTAAEYFAAIMSTLDEGQRMDLRNMLDAEIAGRVLRIANHG